MADSSRLIEYAFPLKQASLDSVHEKNVRHGHISTLHIWPARRPLAACRAALIATLLPDPGDPEKRKELVEKIGGRVIEKIEKKKLPSGKVVEVKKEETIGGILHWGRETENKDTIEWFRQEIRKAYGGRSPKVLDPFAGGGAIPLEAMRLGCEVTAIDINPVAWFILKCTLEYPQKLAGQKRPLPEFIIKDKEFMEAFFKSQGLKGASLRTQLEKLGLGENPTPELKGLESKNVLLEADLSWHVRAWGKWVLNQARKDLARYYPTYADLEPLKPSGKRWEKQESKLIPLKEDGTADIGHLNSEFTKEYLEDPKNPRWVAKPTVAYLWARTVKCKNCRATIPLLKTRWLCKKDRKRVLLTMEPNAESTGVVLGIQNNVPVKGGNTAQRREHDKRIGAGTMSRSGAQCPCCPSIMTMEDIRLEGKAGKLGNIITAVVVEGLEGKEFRVGYVYETKMAGDAKNKEEEIFSKIPYGVINEPLEPASTRSISCQLYGLDNFRKIFSDRQMMALGTFVKNIRLSKKINQSSDFMESIYDYLCLVFGKLVDYCSVFCIWEPKAAEVKHTFARYSLSMPWDFSECNPIIDLDRFFEGGLKVVCEALEKLLLSSIGIHSPAILQQSADEIGSRVPLDVIATDPPYYQAISYGDISDFFYIWLRRLKEDLPQFQNILTPKEKEIVQHIRYDKDTDYEKRKYEDGMFRSFKAAYNSLSDSGRMIVVFAHKDSEAWETAAGAIMKAGFIVSASLPIMTEMPSRQRGFGFSALASSIWLVCKKRQEAAKAGWDNKVLEEMRENIAKRLREFWDAGIRGPDFVWAATGPALEAYSKHPVVKKANDPGKLMEVPEFLRHVRRMVVDFVVGRVLTQDGEEEAISGLDDVTTYYFLHRHDFGMEDAPAGPCILYAVSCGLTDGSLADQFDILQRTGGKSKEAEEDDEEEKESEEPEEVEEGTGSTLRLKQWHQRKRPSMGYDPAIDSAKARTASANLSLFPDLKPDQGPRREIPLIDQIHRLMHLWKAGEVVKVDDYLDTRALLRNHTFHHVLQALIELAPAGSEERSILESISNHLKSRGVTVEDRQPTFLLNIPGKLEN